MIDENPNSYRGDSQLKKAGTKVDWTEDLINEYIKCKEDIFYFVENYFQIVTDTGFRKMEMFDYQREFITYMHDDRFTITCQSRQSGKTTSVIAFLTWYALFHEYKMIAIVANKAEIANKIMGDLQLSYRGLPLWLQLGVEDFNKSTMVLENHTRIKSFPTTKTSLRSYSVDVVYIDETAFVEGWDAFWASVQATTSSRPESKIIMSSTPLGLNHFYEFWMGCDLNGNTNDFHGIYVPWYKVPGRDETWKEAELKKMNYNYAKFAQEHELEFLGSSSTLIAGWRLKTLQNDKQLPIQYAEGRDLKFYEMPVKERKETGNDGLERVVVPAHPYVLLADVARGKDLDHSAFSVIDISSMPYKQVCTYRSNKINVTDYASVIHRVASLYNTAYILTEINDIGEQVGSLLQDVFQYDNLLCTEGAGNHKKLSWGGKKADLGVRTSKQTKNSGCLILKLLVEQSKLLVVDEETINEFNTFSAQKLSWGAEAGKNDDLVMGLVLFAWLTDQKGFNAFSDINTIKELAERNLDQMDEGLIPFGLNIIDYNDGQTYGAPAGMDNMNMPWNPFKNQFDSPFWQDDPALGRIQEDTMKALLLPNF